MDLFSNDKAQSKGLVQQSTNSNSMTSIEVATLTGKQHAHVMRDIRNLLDQGVAASNFGLGSYKDVNQQVRPCYNLTPKGCLILASGYDPVLREKIINRLEELEVQKRNGGFQVPQSFSEALMLAAKQQETIEAQKKQIEQKDKHIEKLQPKAAFAEKAFDMKDKVDVGMAAKILNLGFGRNTLFKNLRNTGVFFASKNEPKQKFVDAKYFEMTEHPIYDDNGDLIKVVAKVLVTQKGLAYINHLFGGRMTEPQLVTIK